MFYQDFERIFSGFALKGFSLGCKLFISYLH